MNFANVADILAQLALDALHQELTSHDIWHHLESRGFRRRQWGKEPHVLAAVKERTNDTSLRCALRRLLGKGSHEGKSRLFWVC